VCVFVNICQVVGWRGWVFCTGTSQQTAWKYCLQNDLYCVERNIKLKLKLNSTQINYVVTTVSNHTSLQQWQVVTNYRLITSVTAGISTINQVCGKSIGWLTQVNVTRKHNSNNKLHLFQLIVAADDRFTAAFEESFVSISDVCEWVGVCLFHRWILCCNTLLKELKHLQTVQTSHLPHPQPIPVGYHDNDDEATLKTMLHLNNSYDMIR